MDEFKKCSQFIKDFRKERNLTQEDLAEVLQYSQKSIAKWEQCVALPPMDVLVKLRELSGKTIDEILGLENFNQTLSEQERRDVWVEQYVNNKRNLNRFKLKFDNDTLDEEEFFEIKNEKEAKALLMIEIYSFLNNADTNGFSVKVVGDKIEIKKPQSEVLDFFIEKGKIEVGFVKTKNNTFERKYYITKDLAQTLIYFEINSIKLIVEECKDKEDKKDLVLKQEKLLKGLLELKAKVDNI